MSAARIRGLSASAGLISRKPLSSASTSSGRTVIYRRLNTRSTQNHRPIDTAHTSNGVIPTLAPLRSQFLPPSISNSAASIRHVSFKELREERARQRAGEAATPPPRPGAPSKTKAEAKPKVEEKQEAAPSSPSSEYSAADAAFASAKAESERLFAREEKLREKQEQEAKEQSEADTKDATEGAEGAEGAQEAAGKKKRAKSNEPEEPPHGTKTPWQVFTETLNAEFKASKEWEESTKQLSGQITDFTSNPNVKAARSAYAKAAEAASSTTGKVFIGTAGAIGKGAAWTWQTPVVKGLRSGAGAVGSGIEKVTRPVRETEAFKNVKDVIDDGASQRYGGWTEKEERQKSREAWEAKMGRKSQEVMQEDPNAGTNVTLHKDSAWKESWKNFRENSPVMQRVFGLGATYRESENPLISTARSVGDRIAGFFAENETARVIKKFREMDPSFQLEPFLTEMRQYILPDVLEAYVKGDLGTLKLWLSAAQFQVYQALMQQYTTAGLKSDGKILDIRNVDILNARILEPGDVPVFVIMCRTQEVHVYRNAKTGELAAGMEDKVQQVTYAIGVTRLPDDVANPDTRGWKLVELQKSGRDYI